MLSPDKQVLVGFGLAIAFLLILGWVFFTTTSRFVENSREAISRAELIAPIRRIFTLTSEAESLQRGYLLTAADFYLERRQEALQELKRTFQWLYAYAQASGYLRWVERARKLEELADRRIELLDDVLARGQSNAQSARDLLAADAGREPMDALQAEVESWLSEQQRILHNKANVAERTGAHVLVVFYVALGFGVLALLVLMYFIQRALQARESTHVALAQSEAQLQESEQRLRAFSESLEQKVAVRTAELQRQTARLQRLTGELTFAEQRERKRLAAILHDDLQQLLVAAQLRLGQARCDAHDARALRAIESTTELLAKAIDASRTLTHQLRPPVLYEGGIVSALRWLASEVSKLHELRVIVDAEDTEPALSEEFRVVLFESVRELLFNVAKHAEVNEATVRVRCKGEALQVTVEDKGVGFDIERIAKERDIERGGLGLFSTRERLAALGGDMTLESTPGVGTSVRVTARLLAPSEHREGGSPAEPFTPESLPEEAASSSLADGPTRVVVADDYTIVRQGIAHVLNDDERVQVVGEAADGVELLEAVERYQPDVVLVDVNMPRMNGVDATREIRRRWPHIRVVAISVQDDATTAKKMIRAGAAALISKSHDPSHIVHVVLVGSHRPAS